MDLPPLPPLHDKLHLQMRGPTLASNWVIPGILMAGAFPGALDDKDNDRQLKCILSKGIDTFVCLQDEVDDQIPEDVWRSGHGLRPYFTDARRLSKNPLVWRHLPILDGGVGPDDVTEALVCDLIDDLKAGRVLYVHCWGGHGRTGIIVALLLAVLYGLPLTEALKRTQACHDCRIEPQGVKSPSTVVQRSQVKRLLEKWGSKNQNEADDALDHQAAIAEVAEGPQLVIGQNGARGFVVSQLDRCASMPSVGKVESGELALRRNPATGSQGKLPISLHARPLQSCQALSKSGSAAGLVMGMQQSKNGLGTRNCAGRAAGTGAACVKMLRKPVAQLALR